MTNAKKFSYTLSLLTLIGLLALLFNYQSIADWWFLRSYTPSPRIAQITEQAGFNDYGQKLFYLTDPQLQNKLDFNESCEFDEYSIVVGCFDGDEIFILDIESGELENGEIVTAAHEMLHMAYVRLDRGEQEDVDRMLLDQAKLIDDEHVLATLELYKEESPTSYTNELHSVIGSEVDELNTDLELYFSNYFRNRQLVVKIAQDYAEVFSELEQQANQLAARLNTLASQLNVQSEELSTRFGVLEANRALLQSRINSGERSQDLINDVESFEASVNSYNNDVTAYRNNIKLYADLLEEYESIALRHDELLKIIDSNYVQIDLVE